MSKPIIGVTTQRIDSRKNYFYMGISEAYLKSVYEAGALPVMIPLGLSETDLDALADRMDGMLFTGGGDIDPDRYGGVPHETVHGIDTDRDRVEIHLIRRTIEKQVPFLGICRGLQTVNVALGGTLHTHVNEQHPGAEKHDWWPDYPRDEIRHPIRIEEGSKLAGILKEPVIYVNSLHHQGVRDLAPGLTPTGYAPDGLIEAIELDNYPFGLAVQWHPEWIYGEHRTPELFEALVKAASNGQ